MNNTVFGLKSNTKIKVIFDLENYSVVRCEGVDVSDVFISDEKAFTMPLYVSVYGRPIFPSKYEIINKGEIVYASTIVPQCRIIVKDDSIFDEKAKTKQYTISFNDLILNESSKRYPSQNNVMGESAREHVSRLVELGEIILDNQQKTDWHWCHLIALSIIGTQKAQKKNNLICATSSCNGHMINIESAVKRFVYENKRPLGIEVTATLYKDTQLAKRIRYRVYDKMGSKITHCEYFEALTDVKTDVVDFDTIYQRMLNKFS
ncbi:MAG: hypothetical protein ACLGGV_09700 [Bacteroidia bacterium]